MDARNLVTCVSTHDVARFMYHIAYKTNYDKLKLAYAFIFTIRGVPMIYYSDEQGFYGGGPPANRDTMFDPRSKNPSIISTKTTRWEGNLTTSATLSSVQSSVQAEVTGGFVQQKFSRVAISCVFVICAKWEGSSGTGFFLSPRLQG